MKFLLTHILLKFKSILFDTSFAGEYLSLKKITENLTLSKGFIVDIAASDGVSQSSTLGFMKNGWEGLFCEMDSIKFTLLSYIYLKFNCSLARVKITPLNVTQLLSGHNVPFNFDLLNLDIDSYDLDVLNKILAEGFLPKIISMEINEKIPPGIYFSVKFNNNHSWKGDHFYGCSIDAASILLKANGYILIGISYNNAMFIRKDINQNVYSELKTLNAYDIGYRNKKNRKQLSPWNTDVESWLIDDVDKTIESIHEKFSVYSGLYDLKPTPNNLDI